MANKQFNSVDGYAIGNATVIIDSNGNVAGNLVTATANVTAPRLISNVATGTAPFVVTSTTQVANLSVATAGSATTAGTVTTAAQPNITSVGTLTSLTVSGNATVGNLITGGGSGGNISGANVITANVVVASTLTSNVATGTAPLTVTSTTRVSNLNVAHANVADFIGVAAGTGNNFLIFANAATGNVSELTSTGLTANLSNNSITATTFIGTLSGAATSATTAGTVTTAAQPNITSVGTLTGLTANGNVTVNQNATEIFTIAARQPPTTDMVVITNTGQNVATAGVSGLQVTYVGGAGAIEASAYRSDMTPGTTSGSTWNAFRVAATTAAASGVVFNGMKFDNKTTGAGTSRAFYVGTGYDEIMNYNGTVVINGNGTVVGGQVVGTVPSATTAGTVTTAAQPNITSVGTLTSLAVSGTTGVTSTDSSGVASTNKIIRAVNGTLDLGFIPKAASGGYNNLTVADDALIVFANSSAQGNANLTIAPWASANTGIRISSVSNTANVQINATNTTIDGFVMHSVTTGISAAGTVQSNATALTTQFNVVSTVSAGQGVRLPTAIAGMRITVLNTSAANLNVYPATSGIINSAAANAAYVQPAGSRLDYISTSTTQWYTLNATYG